MERSTDQTPELCVGVLLMGLLICHQKRGR